MLAQCRPYHAPWSRRFKTFFMRGSFAYELQVGPLVFQRFYQPFQGRTYRVWRDHYWH